MKFFHKNEERKTIETAKRRRWLFEKLNLKGPKTKTKAIAFVDYEHWFYSYYKLYHIKPNMIEWRQKLEEEFDLDDVMVFGDFSYKTIGDELIKIRSVTNSIIETRQTMSDSKKDMTDFVMLDYIYRYVNEHPKTNTYILFTGDAHFQAVVKYLKQVHKKEVIVYGVKNALSSQLREIASKTYELPASDEIVKRLYPIIVKNMAYVSDKLNIIPTFNSTARTLSERNGISEELIKTALSEMLGKGLLYTRKQRVAFNQSVNVLAANWEALEKEGLWTF